MANKIWEEGAVHNLKSAETSKGKMVMQDFSGLHNDKNAAPGPVENYKSGSQAQSHFDQTERRRLNDGDDFSGFLAKKLVGHVCLCVGTHPTHGITAYVYVPSSHSEKKVEVFIGDTSQTLLLSRNEFFGKLEVEPTSVQAIDEICSNFLKRHISMEYGL